MNPSIVTGVQRHALQQHPVPGLEIGTEDIDEHMDIFLDIQTMPRTVIGGGIVAHLSRTGYYIGRNSIQHVLVGGSGWADQTRDSNLQQRVYAAAQLSPCKKPVKWSGFPAETVITTVKA